ncbi:MAG TPA: hypothetical protein VHE83_13960, partial [Mycobacteriales bacterium]|nr:hypothetical protein [Mycobacteriales bacterium]
MLARKPAGEKAEAERPAPAAEETTPADAVDVSAAETTAAETPAAETPAAETTATTEALPEPAAATAPDGAAEQAGGAPTTDESALAHDGATGP